MVAREVIRSANEAFKASPESSGLVGLFVGATSGIAEYTLKSFARYTQSPRIYFAGRNEEAAARIQKETLDINPNATITFIKTPDLTSLAGHDALADEFLAKEKKLDVLVMSAGYLTMKGRDENQEGLDRKMTINYYGRLRLIFDLLPTLRSTASTTTTSTAFTPSVLSILGSGRENLPATKELLDANNLDLSKPGTFGSLACEKVTVTSTSLALEEIALREPTIRFAHIYPGVVVETGAMRELPGVVQGVWKVFKPLVGALAGSKVEDVGEGMFWLLHSHGKGLPGSAGKGSQEVPNAQGKNLYLGQWDGEGKDYRFLGGKVGGICKDVKAQEKWDAERKVVREGVWSWLGEAMGKLGSERVKGLGLWSAEQ